MDYEVSLDDGKTFETLARAVGPYAGNCKYISTSDIPPKTRKALIRFSGQQRNTTGILDFRIDADYRESAGGFAPIKVTYLWDENGKPKKHTHIARSPSDRFIITCQQTPGLKSLIVERAD